MNDFYKVGALFIVALLLTTFAFTRLADGRPKLVERVHAKLLDLPPHHLDVETAMERYKRLRIIAKASVKASDGDREVLAFLFIYGWRESHYALHVHAGKCRGEECDRGKARTPWQTWRIKSMTQEHWDSLVGTDQASTTRAAKYAARLFRMKKRGCGGDTLKGLVAYGTGKCSHETKIYSAKSRHAAMKSVMRELL